MRDLFGAVRDRAIIPYDPDADIGVLLEEFPKVLAAIPELIRHGFYILYAKKWTLTLGIPGQSFHIDIMVIKPGQNPIARLLGFRWFFDQRFYKEKLYFRCQNRLCFWIENFMFHPSSGLFEAIVWG